MDCDGVGFIYGNILWPLIVPSCQASVNVKTYVLGVIVSPIMHIRSLWVAKNIHDLRFGHSDLKQIPVCFLLSRTNA